MSWVKTDKHGFGENAVREELTLFVHKIKRRCKDGLDKHLCDHLLWLIDDYYIIQDNRGGKG